MLEIYQGPETVFVVMIITITITVLIIISAFGCVVMIYHEVFITRVILIMNNFC